MVKEDKRAELGLEGADAFMDEYAFIMAQADELTAVRHECASAKTCAAASKKIKAIVSL